MNKEYEIYYEAFDINDAEARKNFILERCGDDKVLFDNIMRLFPEEENPADDTYGKYTIEKKLGQGGMGIVYLAHYTQAFETETFTKQVALKTINPQFKLEPKSIKIFLKEIKTLAELDHPHIARFLDIGTSANGKPFFVMEYVDGISLTEHCNRHKLSVNERLAFFRQILSAIGYSHQKGFLHCDLKPNNIIVDSKSTPKVIDFGIASKYGSFIAGKNQTTFFQNAFTPNYASPEQIKGEKNLSEATDVYSLGVVLYELLTGQLPIELDANDSYSNLVSTLEKNVPPALKKSITKITDESVREKLAVERDCRTFGELRDRLSGSLNELVQTALNQKPSRRYASVKDFDEAINDYLNEESFFKQIGTVFSILYRKSVRRLKRISLKWAVGAFLFFLLLAAALSQNKTALTIFYYVQIGFSSNDKQIGLSNAQKATLEHSIPALKEKVLVNFNETVTKFSDKNDTGKNNIWSLANYIVGLNGIGHSFDRDLLDTLLEKNQTAEGCWHEEKTDCKMIVSGWVMLAKKDLGKSFGGKQLDFVLTNQSAEGWFPAYPYLDRDENAATYPTAVIIWGLTEQLQNNLLRTGDRERVGKAIEKGVQWLLRTRKKDGDEFLWSDCPNVNLSSQTPSHGIDGTVIYTLHKVEKVGLRIPNLTNELKEIDSLWLENLAQMPDFPLEHKIDGRCSTVTNEGDIMDRTIRFSIPWSIAATVEAFPNGTLWQKAIARRWLENLPLAQEYKGFSFGASEHLIALTTLR